MLGEGKSVSWGGAQTKGEVHKHKLANKIFFHSDLLKSLNSSLTQLFLTIRKLALRTNEIKRWRSINQSNRIIHTFDLRRTLAKYLRTFLHVNIALIIGLTDQSDYSICHFMVRLFIHTVLKISVNSSIFMVLPYALASAVWPSSTYLNQVF